MSLRSSGSFSLRTTAAVVCLENTETHPCETLERRTTAATCSVTSMNSRAAVVRKASVSARSSGPRRDELAHPHGHRNRRVDAARGWRHYPQIDAALVTLRAPL